MLCPKEKSKLDNPEAKSTNFIRVNNFIENKNQ